MRTLKGTITFALAVICCSCGLSARSVTVQPSSIAFGTQAINTTSAAKSITISNETQKTISVSEINVQVTPTGIFSVSGWSGSVLPAGGSITAQVTFRPSAAQTYNGTITFGSNGVSRRVAVSGTGTTSGSTVGIGINPSSATVTAGATQQFAASVTGTSNTAVTWSVNGVAGGNSTVGTISSTGLYTAPATVPSGSVVVKATSGADSTKSASATVTITTATVVAVGLTPKTASLQAGQTQQFTAAVTGTSNTAVTWAVNNFVGGNTTVGTISSTGLYTAPQTVTSSTTVTVTAQSVADNSKTASASVSLSPTTQNVSITINPTTATVAPGATKQFAATVTGTTTTGVKWLVNGVAGGSTTLGTISTTGLYTAPSAVPTGGKVTVTATSTYDVSKSANAQVTIATAPTPIKISTTTLPAAQFNQSYSAQLSATGGTSPYTWSVVSGQLPAGLSMSSGGLITGTPTAAGTYDFSVTAKDSAASPQAATTPLSLTVNATTPAYLWRNDFESGNLDGWYSPSTSATGNYGGGIYNSGTASVTASKDFAHGGSYSAKATITTPNSPTSAVRLFRWQESHANRELYYSIWVYVPTRYYLTANANTGRFWNLFQFKSSTTDKSRNDPFWAFYVDDTASGLYVSAGWGAGGTTLAGPTSTSGVGLKSYKQTIASVPIGRWVHYEAFLRESNGFDGQLTLWQDGVKLFDFQNVRTSYNNCTYNSWCADNAWSVNLYSDGMSPNPATIYFDDAAISKSFIP